MKNHLRVNGQLLQMNKKYSALKQKQKEQINQWLIAETEAYYLLHQRYPVGRQSEDVVDNVYRLGQEPVQCEDTFFLSFQNGCCQAVKSAITAQIKSNRSLLNQVLCNDIQPFLYFLTLQNLCMAEKGHDHVASSLSRPSSYRFRAFFVP